MGGSSENLLLLIHGVTGFSISGGLRQELCSGVCQIVRLPADNGCQILIALEDLAFYLLKDAPSLRTGEREYIFPQPSGIFYGFLLCSTCPSDIVDAFETILGEWTTFRLRLPRTQEGSPITVRQESIEAPPQTREEWFNNAFTTYGPSIATGLETGSRKMSAALVAGAVIVANRLQHYGQQVAQRRSVDDADMRQPPQKLTPEARARLSTARTVSSTAANVTSRMATGVHTVTKSVARRVSTAVGNTEWGQKIVNADGPKVTIAKDIAVTTVRAAGEVLASLEHAARVVGSAGAAAATIVVESKYGREAGQAASDALATVGNVGRSAFNMRAASVRGFVRSTAARTGMGLVAPTLPGGPPGTETAEIASTSSSSNQSTTAFTSNPIAVTSNQNPYRNTSPAVGNQNPINYPAAAPHWTSSLDWSQSSAATPDPPHSRTGQSLAAASPIIASGSTAARDLSRAQTLPSVLPSSSQSPASATNPHFPHGPITSLPNHNRPVLPQAVPLSCQRESRPHVSPSWAAPQPAHITQPLPSPPASWPPEEHQSVVPGQSSVPTGRGQPYVAPPSLYDRGPMSQ